MVLEPGGNFLYLGGGYDFSPAPSSSLSGPANRCRSAGWIASVYLRRSELTASEQTIVTSSLLTAHPVQAMCFHGSDLITGGLVSGLRYYNTSPLGLSALSLPPSLSPHSSRGDLHCALKWRLCDCPQVSARHRA
jgi:hypothetical protein